MNFDYRLVVKDPTGNTIQIRNGYVNEKGNIELDYRQPHSLLGGYVVGTISIEWTPRIELPKKK
jgi:hypothetical protein